MAPTYYHVLYDNQEMRDAGVRPWTVVTTQLDAALDHLRTLLDGTNTAEGGPFDSISVAVEREEAEPGLDEDLPDGPHLRLVKP